MALLCPPPLEHLVDLLHGHSFAFLFEDEVELKLREVRGHRNQQRQETYQPRQDSSSYENAIVGIM